MYLNVFTYVIYLPLSWNASFYYSCFICEDVISTQYTVVTTVCYLSTQHLTACDSYETRHNKMTDFKIEAVRASMAYKHIQTSLYRQLHCSIVIHTQYHQLHITSFSRNLDSNFCIYKFDFNNFILQPNILTSPLYISRRFIILQPPGSLQPVVTIV